MDEGCIHTTIRADIRFVNLPHQHLTQKVQLGELLSHCSIFGNFLFSMNSAAFVNIEEQE